MLPGDKGGVLSPGTLDSVFKWGRSECRACRHPLTELGMTRRSGEEFNVYATSEVIITRAFKLKIEPGARLLKMTIVINPYIPLASVEDRETVSFFPSP